MSRGRVRTALVWLALGVVLAVPIGAAALSPLLEWREPVYIAAGFAGIIAMALMLVQPLLAGAYLPGLSVHRSRQIHRVIGGTLVAAVLVHVGGLWITSPPDVVDALLFVSPTTFSVWGVIAMWALFASAVLALMRRRLGLRVWRLVHATLAAVIISGTVVHAVLIDGTMETVSKVALGVLLVVATVKAVADLRGWTARRRA